jgi:hypothetical protein
MQQFAEGPYSIDADRLWKLYYDRRRTENYLSTKFSPAKLADEFLMPKVTNIEIDWEGAAAEARGYADTATATTCYKLSSREISSAASLRQHLKAEYGSLESARTRFTDRLQQNGRANSEALRSNIAGWETAIAGARFVRNASTTVLVVGATVLTAGTATGLGVAAANAGGAALGFTAVASGLTGVGKAQDCERHLTTEQAVGVAIVSGGLDFVVSVVSGGVGKGAKFAGKAIIALVTKVPTKTITSLMLADMTRRKDEPAPSLGAHAWSALQDWAIDQAAGAIGDKILKVPAVNRWVRKIAVAGASVIQGKSDAKAALIGKTVRKVVSSGTSDGVKAAGAAGMSTIDAVVSAGPPRDKMPEAMVRQPVFGGAALESAVLNSILSPLASGLR